MKAVRVGTGGAVSVAEVAVPAIGRGEALLRTRAAGICGSDLTAWYVRTKAGQVLGHEISGELAEVGEGVNGFAVGDRVVPHHHAACLECDACRAGLFVHCETWRSSNLDPGGMAEYVRIPAVNLERDTRPVLSSLSHEEASFTEPLATVVKAFRRGRFAAGQSLLAVGLGPMGQLAVRLARSLGASRIAGADRVAFRIARAKESGCDDAFDVDSEPLADGALRLSSGKGFDFVFVGPGKSGVIREAGEAAASGGTVLFFTMPPPEERLALSGNELYFREISLVPSYSCGPQDTRRALELLESDRIRVADLVTHRYPIERAVEAFERARDPRDCMKVMITF